jgi:hypothetical protein
METAQMIPDDHVTTNLPGETGVVIAFAWQRPIPDRYSVPVLIDDTGRWNGEPPVVAFAESDLTRIDKAR